MKRGRKLNNKKVKREEKGEARKLNKGKKEKSAWIIENE